MPRYINPKIREYTSTMQGGKKCLPWTDGNIQKYTVKHILNKSCSFNGVYSYTCIGKAATNHNSSLCNYRFYCHI